MNWIYVVVFLSAVGGYGVSQVWTPTEDDLARELLAARMQIEEMKRECPAKALKRVPLKHSRGDEF